MNHFQYRVLAYMNSSWACLRVSKSGSPSNMFPFPPCMKMWYILVGHFALRPILVFASMKVIHALATISAMGFWHGRPNFCRCYRSKATAVLFYAPSGTYKTANPRKESIYYPLVTEHRKRIKHTVKLQGKRRQKGGIHNGNSTECPEIHGQGICTHRHLDRGQAGRR